MLAKSISTTASVFTLVVFVAIGAKLSTDAANNPDAPDIKSVPPDLTPPAMEIAAPSAGRRVRDVVPKYAGTDVYHSLFLPTDWNQGSTFPVIVEFAGNGPTRSRYNDICTGRVEDSSLGYGLSGGSRYIWICVPYLNNAGNSNVTRWWGEPPEHDPTPTVDYCVAAVQHICEQYGGDPDSVALCGFSRGAIACNFIGLHDDRIARLWKASIAYSHYDGVETRWGYPGADRQSALRRLKRLGQRPQYIVHEVSNNTQTNLAATRTYLQATGVDGQFHFHSTGFRNHSDKWILRPGPAREQLRQWFDDVMQVEESNPHPKTP